MKKQEKKFEVTLYLHGEGLDPVQTSQLLGIEPTKSQRKGEEQFTSTNRKVIAMVGMWALVAQSDSDELSVLIDELALKIGDKADLLSTVPGVQKAFLDVFIAMDAEPEGGETCELQLSAENLLSLKRFGIDTHITMAVVKV